MPKFTLVNYVAENVMFWIGPGFSGPCSFLDWRNNRLTMLSDGCGNWVVFSAEYIKRLTDEGHLIYW